MRRPPGPTGFGTGSGSVSAVVVTSASMRERAVFIGSISVWDTIGTLRPSGIEIVTLFGLVYCRVMGRKAPRKRLAYRVISAFTRVFDAHDTPHGCLARTRTSLGAPPTPRFGVSEARMQTPGAENAPRERGGVCACDRETGDGRFRICRKTGKYRDRTSQRVPRRSAFTRVFHALCARPTGA